MRPKDLVNQLRRIASKIENSSRPSKELVSRDIRSVLAAMTSEKEKEDSGSTIERADGNKNMNGLESKHEPAVERADGSKFWGDVSKNVKGYKPKHEPAVERNDGGKFWEDVSKNTKRYKPNLNQP